METIQYLYHFIEQSISIRDLIDDYGFYSYPSDSSYFDGIMCKPGFPFCVFFMCFLFNGKMPDQSQYPRGHNGSFYRAEYSLNNINTDEYSLFKVKSSLVNDSIHHHLMLVHPNSLEEIKEAVGDEHLAKMKISINNNDYFCKSDGVWKTKRYTSSDKQIVNIALFNKNVIFPDNWFTGSKKVGSGVQKSIKESFYLVEYNKNKTGIISSSSSLVNLNHNKIVQTGLLNKNVLVAIRNLYDTQYLETIYFGQWFNI